MLHLPNPAQRLCPRGPRSRYPHEVLFSRSVEKSLRDVEVMSRVDDSANTIGKRYVKADELGISLGVTVDHASLSDRSITLRDINTTSQLRLPVRRVCDGVDRQPA